MPDRVRYALVLGIVLSLGPKALAQPAAPESDLEVPAAPAPRQDDAVQRRIGELEERLRALTEQIARDRAAQAEQERQRARREEAARDKSLREAALSPPVLSTVARPDSGVILDPIGLVFSGVLQAQYLGSQLSEDQLQQGGIPLNRDGFSLRLARLRLDGSWKWARVAVELSGNTVAGLYLGVLRAEASFLWRNPKPATPPYVMVTGGLQELHFGYELAEGVRRRPFMERTLGSLALFPGTTDLGLRVSGGVSFFRYALAAMNGSPVIERAGAPYALNLKAKDLLGRLGFDTARPEKRWMISGGVSFLIGSGFHAGSDATIGTVQWRDSNENGSLDAGELVALPGRAATPSDSFRRWAVNLDLAAKVQSSIGWTQVYGEVTLASNLDRGLFPSDPIAVGYDVRQIAGYLAVTQQILRWGIVGLRYDYYNPNADLSDNRRGALIPRDAGIHTISPVVGVSAFDHLRLLFQYDAVFDSLARDVRGVPTDLSNNQWTVRLQGEL